MAGIPCPTSPQAHPRWRGEHTSSKLVTPATSGSSPLARGAPRHFVGVGEGFRLIPAGAGSTVDRKGVESALTAHPRWRGEHIARQLKDTATNGSSPLARGALSSFDLMGEAVRLIPAGAGSTPSPGLTSRTSSAHPRWRGEHARGMWMRSLSPGSSPLARGARGITCALEGGNRLIPAGAGSTSFSRSCRGGASAHPRWRGEHTL